MINSGTVSVVIQGPIKEEITACSRGLPLTRAVCASVRASLPEAEIILSTWQGNKADDCRSDCDKIIYNQDPGAVGGGKASNKFINVNRQITSTICGLKQATKPFSIKIRSDVLLKNNNFLTQRENRSNKKLLRADYFAEKILVSTANCPNMLKYPAPFHIGEYFYFGRTADLKNLWSVPFATDELAVWRRLRPAKGSWRMPEEKMAAEQYLLISFLNKMGSSLDLESYTTANPACLFESELFLGGNFWFLPIEEIGAVLPPHLEHLDDRTRGHHRADYKFLNLAAYSPVLFYFYSVLRMPMIMAKVLHLRLQGIG